MIVTVVKIRICSTQLKGSELEGAAVQKRLDSLFILVRSAIQFSLNWKCCTALPMYSRNEIRVIICLLLTLTAAWDTSYASGNRTWTAPFLVTGQWWMMNDHEVELGDESRSTSTSWRSKQSQFIIHPIRRSRARRHKEEIPVGANEIWHCGASNLSSWNLNDQLQIPSSSSIFEIPQREVEVELELDLKSSKQAIERQCCQTMLKNSTRSCSKSS